MLSYPTALRAALTLLVVVAVADGRSVSQVK